SVILTKKEPFFTKATKFFTLPKKGAVLNPFPHYFISFFMIWCPCLSFFFAFASALFVFFQPFFSQNNCFDCRSSQSPFYLVKISYSFLQHSIHIPKLLNMDSKGIDLVPHSFIRFLH